MAGWKPVQESGPRLTATKQRHIMRVDITENFISAGWIERGLNSECEN
jgi:hypothetical protein